MPAESESQRKAAGAAVGAKRDGSVTSLRGASKDMLESMTEDELEDFASKSISSIEKQPQLTGGRWSGDKTRTTGDAIQSGRILSITAGVKPAPPVTPSPSAPTVYMDKSHHEDSLIKANMKKI